MIVPVSECLDNGTRLAGPRSLPFVATHANFEQAVCESPRSLKVRLAADAHGFEQRSAGKGNHWPSKPPRDALKP